MIKRSGIKKSMLLLLGCIVLLTGCAEDKEINIEEEKQALYRVDFPKYLISRISATLENGKNIVILSQSFLNIGIYREN